MSLRSHAPFRRRLLAATALGGLAALALTPAGALAQTVDGRRTEPLNVTASGGDPVRIEILPGASIDSSATAGVAITTTSGTGATTIDLGGSVRGAGGGVDVTSGGGPVTIRGPGIVTTDSGDGIAVGGTTPGSVFPSMTAIYGIGRVEAFDGAGIVVNSWGFEPGSSGAGGSIAIGVDPETGSGEGVSAAKLHDAVRGKTGIEAVTSGQATISIATATGGSVTGTEAEGIKAVAGRGATSISIGGSVFGSTFGISAESFSGRIDIGGGGDVHGTNLSGGSGGIRAFSEYSSKSDGDGITISGTGATTATGTGNAIDAQITSTGASADITIDRSGPVRAAAGSGINVDNKGTGAATVTVGGEVTSETGTAIKVRTASGAAKVSILKGATVRGPKALDVSNDTYSDTAVTIDNAGTIAGSITARRGGSNDVTVTNSGTVALGRNQDAGSVTNRAGGVVTGTGQVTTLTAEAGSVIRPGDWSPGGATGELRAFGLTMQTGSRLEVRAPVVGEAEVDRVQVMTGGSLDGATIALQAPSGDTRRWAPGVAYTVLSGFGLSVTNLTVTTDLAFLRPSGPIANGDYYPDNPITVTLVPKSTAEIAEQFASPAARTIAGLAIAAQEGGATGDAGEFASRVLNLSAEAAGPAMEQLSGSASTGGQTAALSGSGLFSSNILTQTLVAGGLTGGGAPSTGGSNAPAYAADEPVQTAALKAATPKDAKEKAAAPAASTWRLWATGLGAQSTTEARAASPRVTGNDWGLAAGFDYAVDPALVAGVSLGGTSSRFSVGSGATTGTTEGLHASLYGVATFDDLYVAGSLGYGRLETRARRGISPFGSPERYTAKYATDAFAGQAEIGYRVAWEAFTITPFAGLQATLMHQHAYRESSETAGGVAALAFKAQDTWSVPGQLGLQVERGFALDGGWLLTGQVRAAWVHEFSPERKARPGFVALPGSSFTVDGIAPVADFARLTGGVTLANDKGTSLFASLTSDLSNASRSYAVQGGLKVEW